MTKRLALVTGGIGGLGTAACRALADSGHQVVANYYPKLAQQARDWQAKQREDGYEFDIVAGDVANFDSCEKMTAEIAARQGTVQILVNNAGITRDGTLKKMPCEAWYEVINTNLNSVFNVTKQVLDGMLECGFGRIINIASVNGRKGQFGQANYASAKSGVHGFTMSLAQETARKGVTVNTVSPGYIATEMVMTIAQEVREQIVTQIPVGRFGAPEEIGRVVAFLADEASGFITGSDLSINGGLHMY